MRLDMSQQLRLEQQMKLAPRIIQAMEILQLPMMALQERIEAELQSNPVLEMRQAAQEPAAPVREQSDQPTERGEHDLVVDADNGNSEDFERLAEFGDEFGADSIASDAPYRSPQAAAEASDRKMEAMANTPAPQVCLNEYLHEQWSFVEADEAILRAGRVIIDHIDDDGYLRVPLEQLVEKVGDGATLQQMQEALRLVQTLEPTGVGARDLRECLLLQLRAEEATGADVSLEVALVENHLRDIEMNRLPHIAKRTGKSLSQIKRAIENLSHLNPRPGLLIGSRPVPVINPDVIVTMEDGQVVVKMNDGDLPLLRISRTYSKLVKDRNTDKQAKQFLRKNIRSAQWIISAIEQRRETIRRVAEEVFHAQRDFLERGLGALKPLPMAQVARKVGVHVATVSRAVSGKYAQTPWGIYPLRMFFSGGTTAADGQAVAWDAVKTKLKQLVDAEDKSCPLSDDQLAAELEKQGLKIARRTVAKYRKLLGIPSARKRREY